MSEFGLILCECGRILDEELTETYQEQHDAGHYTPMSRTTCCGSGYTDLDGQTIVDFLTELRDWRATDGIHVVVMGLPEIKRENIDAIIPVLEQKFDL